MFVALEIGNAVTKIVYGKKTKKKFTIKKYSLIQNSETVFLPDGKVNLAELTPILKRALKSMKIRKADVYITLSSTSSIVRLREFPLVPIKQMQEMLRYDAEQFLPYDVNAFSMDFRINQIKLGKAAEHDLSDKPLEKVAEVMVIVHPTKLMENQIKLASNLKQNVQKITNYTEAVYSYFYAHILNDKQNIIVADLGYENMRLTMFQGKQYFANSVADIGIKSLQQELSNMKQISEQDANKLLFNPNASIAPTNPTSSATKADVSARSSRLQALASKLKKKEIETQRSSVPLSMDDALENLYEQVGRDVGRMIEFFKTRQFGFSVDGIYLIGGGANLSGLDAFLSQYHGMEVRKILSPDKSVVSDADYSLLIPSIGCVLDQEVVL